MNVRIRFGLLATAVAAGILISGCGGDSKVSGTVHSKWTTPQTYKQTRYPVNTQSCSTRTVSKRTRNASGKYVTTNTPERTCSMKFDHWGPYRQVVDHKQAYHVSMVSGEQFCVNSYDWFNAHVQEQASFYPVPC